LKKAADSSAASSTLELVTSAGNSHSDANAAWANTDADAGTIIVVAAAAVVSPTAQCIGHAGTYCSCQPVFLDVNARPPTARVRLAADRIHRKLIAHFRRALSGNITRRLKAARQWRRREQCTGPESERHYYIFIHGTTLSSGDATTIPVAGMFPMPPRRIQCAW